MKISCTLLGLICLHLLPAALCSLTLQQYASKLLTQSDRTYYPTPKSMCDNEPYRSTRSCQLLRTDKNRLRQLTDRFLRYEFHYWKRVEARDITTSASNDLNVIVRSRTSGTSNRAYSRKRRATARPSYNPCSNEVSARTTMFYGRDAETGQILELLQNPDRKMYQTFFTHACSSSMYYWMSCEVYYVVYLAATFAGNSNNVVVRPVKIPTSCGLRVPR